MWTHGDQLKLQQAEQTNRLLTAQLQELREQNRLLRKGQSDLISMGVSEETWDMEAEFPYNRNTEIEVKS